MVVETVAVATYVEKRRYIMSVALGGAVAGREPGRGIRKIALSYHRRS